MDEKLRLNFTSSTIAGICQLAKSIQNNSKRKPYAWLNKVLITRDLGITTGRLSRWEQLLTNDEENAFLGKGKVQVSEVEQLKKELVWLKEENEILKSCRPPRYLHQALSVKYPFIYQQRGLFSLAALIKLNLPFKDMATTLGISQDSLRIARYRLKKKLSMEPEDSLSSFIQRV